MGKGNKTIQENTHDPYFVKGKYLDPSVCKNCNVVYSKGVFRWKDELPKDANSFVCPACKRVNDNYEGGVIFLEGDFIKMHGEEILNLIKNTESSEKEHNPLERIIHISKNGSKVEVKTTYEHLARRIGEAIHRAFKGELKFNYPADDKYIRVYWSRTN